MDGGDYCHTSNVSEVEDEDQTQLDTRAYISADLGALGPPLLDISP